MKRNLCKNVLVLIVLVLIFTSCGSSRESAREPVGNDCHGSVTDISDDESFETNNKTTTVERLSSTDTNNSQAQNDPERFTVSIQLYDTEKGKAVPYSQYLTMQEQSFLLDFSLPADKSSVEKSIDDNILSMWHGEYVKPVKPTISFNWINEATLILTVDNLTSNTYSIHPINSKDATGMYSIGEGRMIDEHGVHFSMLDFEILNQQKIYVFDLDTLNHREIPLKSRYYYAFGSLSPSGRTAFIGRITDSAEAVNYMPSFIDLANENIIDPFNHTFMDITGNWAMDKLLLYNMLLDTESGTCNTVLEQVLSSLMLRNGEYISLNTANDTGSLILTRYNAEGSTVMTEELPDSYNVRIWEGSFFQRPILYELADGSVITTFYDTRDQVYNVYKLNFDSSKDLAVMLHENSFIAAISPDAKRYAIYKAPQVGFIGSNVEIYSLDGLQKTIVDEELTKNMCLFWQNDSLYICNSGYPDHFYIHAIDVNTGKGRTIRPKVTDNVLGLIGITPEGEAVLIDSHYSMALFR